jgi:hypothetical protein
VQGNVTQNDESGIFIAYIVWDVACIGLAFVNVRVDGYEAGALVFEIGQYPVTYGITLNCFTNLHYLAN